MIRTWIRRISIVFVLLSPSIVHAAAMVVLPSEPPIMVSGLEVDCDGISWFANTEDDLGGYLVHFSIGGDGFVSVLNQVIDVGNVTNFSIDDPLLEPYVEEGPMYFGVSAYDQAAGGVVDSYEDGDNVSGITSTNDSNEDVFCDFFRDAPPASIQGLDKM